MAEEEAEGVGLPQKGLNMIIKDALPDMRIANETREVLNQCCVEFIKLISKEAQTISSKDQRKTIYHDHVQKALKNLGFPREYIDAANSVLGECKIAAEKRLKRKNSRLDKCGIPEEQLWQMQQRLIEQARREEAEKQHAAFSQFGGSFEHFGGGPSSFPNSQLAFNYQQSQQQQQISSSPQFLIPSLPSLQQQQIITTTITSSTSTSTSSTSTSQQQQQLLSTITSTSSSLMNSTMPFGLTAQQLIVPEHQQQQQQLLLPELTTNTTTAQMLLFGGKKNNENEDDEEEEENYDI
ncbi:CBFD_NFYB_HMF domain-containing protein [Meloidogyne graminicola]|uniref:Protein Dr1 n=1 Tax=Meloidogyne graminicola TaxID=189291 RepID=A0A8T0A0M7_9BILA|nr:CBFD_NFYB_HMF domain-containing protein [Meloidogyne graminicola]